MFVCLCTGATSQVVNEIVESGATTSKEVAEACGAGADCGRCRRTIRAIIAAHQAAEDRPSEFNGCPSRATR
ncbi:(2Fe-2S)-binding protein [Mycobacterium sp. 48b]|jgi:bacterioferritin-associated ferredoxin|uniref:(2Fe-2S)-binding protein n=1 Tax=Mycobacterium sp. 48b TaxID=3400426 RepID=UPI003AAF5D0C